MSEPELDYFDEAPFVLALEASPEDDISRLAYADWLEERGDPRAGYLRAVAALRQAVRERDATPEDWFLVHRYWQRRHAAWQQDVGGRFDVAVTKFGREIDVGYVLGRSRASALAYRCRDSGWELVHHRLSLDRAAQACRRLTSAGCTTVLRAARLAYPYDHSRLAVCFSDVRVGEMVTMPLPQGTLTAWADTHGRPAVPRANAERQPAIFTGQHGSTVLADVAALDLLARTSGYVPEKPLLDVILPATWYILDKPDGPTWQDRGVDFYCHDGARGWTLRCEYRASGCHVSAVERGVKGPR